MGNAPTCCCNSDARGAAVPPEEHVAKAMVMAARSEGGAAEWGGSVPTLQTPHVHNYASQPFQEQGPEPAEPEGEEAADKNTSVSVNDTDAPLMVPPPVEEPRTEVTYQAATEGTGEAAEESEAKEEAPAEATAEGGNGQKGAPVERVWEIELRRTPTESSLGVSLYVSPTHLVIHGISAGMVRTFNQTNPALEVKRGTVIIEVNGRADSSQAMFNALRSESVLRVKLKRLSAAKLTIEKDGPLGVDVSPSSMEVKMVKENGAVELYNRACKAGYQMSPGDTITEVNGISGDVKAMLREIASSAGHITISIQRD